MQQEIYDAEGYHKNTEPTCDNMWANINYKYSHNKNHVHPGAQWSGVYYIKTPKQFAVNCTDKHLSYRNSIYLLVTWNSYKNY